MSFKDMVSADLHGVFLRNDEFASRRTIHYDGSVFTDIPVVLSGLKEKDRRQLQSDHAQGLYLVSAVLHCSASDIGGKQPEKGARISISDDSGFLREFYVASSVVELGMVRCELEAVDE